MGKFKLLLMLILIFFSVGGFAEEKEIGTNYMIDSGHANFLADGGYSLSKIHDKVKKDENLKNLEDGHYELSPTVNFGYSSFSGVFLEGSAAYRYFFRDRMSIGGVFDFGVSKFQERYGFGPSFRWYFWGSGKWATSFTQELLFAHQKYKNLGMRFETLTGTSEFGVHYFFTKDFSLNLGLGTRYELYNSDYSQESPTVYSNVGFTFHF